MRIKSQTRVKQDRRKSKGWHTIVVHVRVILDALALGHGAESLEQRPEIGRLDVALLAEVAHVQLHRDGASKIDDFLTILLYFSEISSFDASSVGVGAAE